MIYAQRAALVLVCALIAHKRSASAQSDSAPATEAEEAEVRPELLEMMRGGLNSERPPTPEDDAFDDSGFGAVAEVDVSTSAPGPSSAQDRVIEPGMLRHVPRRSAEELLTLAPGVVLANHSGEGHASTLFVRGFDAGEGQDVEVLVDSIPINEPSNAHQHGYADPHFLIPELVGGLQIQPGVFDSAQGDFALAGSFDYRLEAPERGVHVLGGYGSFARRRALVMVSDGEDTFAGFEYQAGSGFGANRNHRNLRLVAKHTGGSDELRWTLLAATHALEFDSAGVVRDDGLDELSCDEPFYCTLDPNQGGSASRHLIGGSLHYKRPHQSYRQGVWLQLRRSRFRENFTGALLDARGDGLDEKSEALTIGLRGDYVVERRFLDRPQQIRVGYLGRHDLGQSAMTRIRLGDGVPYERVFDSELGLTHGALYLDGRLSLPRVEVRAGVRVAAYVFHVVDLNQPEADRIGPRLSEHTMDAFGVAVLPRMSVAVELAEGLSWITSLGRGARASDAQALSEGERAPFAVSRNLESGLVLSASVGASQLEARASAYWTYVDRDLLFDPQAGRNIPVGSTHRVGATGSVRWQLAQWLDVLGSLSWTEAHLTPESAGPFDVLSGPRLPFVPRWVGRLDASLEHDVPIRNEPVTLGFSVGGGVLGRRPLPLEELSSRVSTLDVSVRARWRYVEIALQGRNLLDSRNRVTELFYESQFDPEADAPSLRAARHFAAGPPRELMLQLTFHLDTWAFASSGPGDEL